MWANTLVAVMIFALPNFLKIYLEVFSSKYLINVLIPFFIAIFPIFSGVIPKTLCFFLKLFNKFPSFEPTSIMRSLDFRLISLEHSL